MIINDIRIRDPRNQEAKVGSQEVRKIVCEGNLLSGSPKAMSFVRISESGRSSVRISESTGQAGLRS